MTWSLLASLPPRQLRPVLLLIHRPAIVVLWKTLPSTHQVDAYLSGLP